MKKLLVILGCAIFVAAIGGVAGAATTLVDDNFNNGLVNWIISPTGDVEVGQAGTFLTLQGMTDSFALLGKDVNAGLSEISRTVFAPVGTQALTVSFSWAFDFFDFSLANDALVSVLTPQGLMEKRMVDINTGIGIGAVNGFFFQNFNIPELAAGGNVEIAFSLFEDPAKGTNSFAGIDDVSIVAQADIAAVPIPSTLLLLGSGLIGMVGLRRRKRA